MVLKIYSKSHLISRCLLGHGRLNPPTHSNCELPTMIVSKLKRRGFFHGFPCSRDPGFHRPCSTHSFSFQGKCFLIRISIRTCNEVRHQAEVSIRKSGNFALVQEARRLRVASQHLYLSVVTSFPKGEMAAKGGGSSGEKVKITPIVSQAYNRLTQEEGAYNGENVIFHLRAWINFFDSMPAKKPAKGGEEKGRRFMFAKSGAVRLCFTSLCPLAAQSPP